jgi:hypothetical protein
LYHILLWHSHSKKYSIKNNVKWKAKINPLLYALWKMIFFENLKLWGYDMKGANMSEIGIFVA